MHSLQTLATLSEEHSQVLASVIANGGEVPPGSDLEAAFERTAQALAVKTDHLASFVLDLRGAAEARRAALKKALAHCDAQEALADRLLAYADRVMAERTEIAGECFTLKRKKNPPAVKIIEEFKVRLSCPEAVKRTPLENGTYEVAETPQGNVVYALSIDKNALKDCLKRGQHIDGAMLVQGHRIEVV